MLEKRKIPALIFAILTAGLSQLAVSNEGSTQYLQEMVEMSCPGFWEDLAVDIDATQRTGDLWQGDQTDKESFITYLGIVLSDTTLAQAELVAMASNKSIVSRECASQRVALKQHQLDSANSNLLISLNAEGAELEGFQAAIDNPALNGSIHWMIPIYNLILN